MEKKLGRTGEELEVMEQSGSWKVKFLLGRTRRGEQRGSLSWLQGWVGVGCMS